MSEDEYNVSGYTEEELLEVLDLNNPSDRELEAKLLSMIRKYSIIGNESGNKLSQFFIDIYNRFFENPESEYESEKEGFESGINSNNNPVPNAFDSGPIGNTLPPNVKPISINSKNELSNMENGMTSTANMGSRVTLSQDNLKLTKQLDYAKDKLNPLLKQTIKRIISIDSQYRNKQKDTSPSTSFTFDLSEPLRDVVSLSLYSVQIPYTWYTVNSDFGGNFFYLKGITKGINNGLHDYKIEIPAGNYTPVGLATAVNEAIRVATTIYTDTSFGQTMAIYNNGVADQDSGTGKCAIQVDITKVYNEGNYYLQFPNWSTPLDDVIRLNTLASYLGFNNTNYYCSSIHSTFFSTNIKNVSYAVKSVNNGFKIVPYVGNSYLTATTYFTAIDVSFNLTEITSSTISNMVTLLDNTLSANTRFDNLFTHATLIDISNELQYGYTQSYIKFECKLNPLNAPIVPNLKLAAVFPYDPVESLFFGAQSFFAFSDSIKDASNNVICELNELIAESPILQSSYTSNNTSLTFRNVLTGYDNSYNNIRVTVPNGIYTLNTFISSVNIGINNYILSRSYLNANIELYSNSKTGFLNFRNKIDNAYFNSSYSIYATVGRCNLPDIFGLQSSPNNTATTNIYNNSNYQFTTVAFDASDVIYITPISPGNQTANTFVIQLNTINAYSNGANLANFLNSRIAEYRDPVTGLYPLSGSSVSYDINNKFTLNLNINLNLNQLFYSLELDGSLNPINSKNVWSDLSFNSSYNIIDYSNNNYIITNNISIKDNEITIFDGSNDVIYLSPSTSVDVFNTSGDSYLIRIKIPDTSIDGEGTRYAINEIINVMNSNLVNTIANGTTFSTNTLANGQTFIRVRFNINKVFKTSDYSLVFYDPYSFAKCFSNTSKNTSNSIQNATWDTTLGWLLGYRDQISYKLSDYVGINYSSQTIERPNNYYLIESNNVCVLIGDTNVSTNLYNYFLIMLDDYVQNHLNDGLVTITNQETSIAHEPYKIVCDPVSGQNSYLPANYGEPGINYTPNQLYAFNQKVQSQIVKDKSYSKGPFVQDIFGLIPIKTTGMKIGSVYVEFGGSLQNQQRLYFGPVNIHRMSIKLLNDRGNIVDLNKNNWSFSFICEQLYNNGVS